MKKHIARRGLAVAGVMSLLAGTFLAQPVWARTNHALLVAVTAYPELGDGAALVGPNHDAELVRDYLTKDAPVKFEAGNVTLLADGVESASLSPTRTHILASLKAVTDRVERDDFVYLHFSGHGAQQPETVDGNETDGLDEIFLPADTGKWVDKASGVPNALMDDDIGAALDAIRDKGAFVWVVFDACHSGNATRVAPIGEEGYVERKLGSTALGIPEQAILSAKAAAEKVQGDKAGVAAAQEREAAFTLTENGSDKESSRSLPAEQDATGAAAIAKGGMVAFFAAQTTETTPEMPLPRDTPEAPRYGLFTYTLFSKLAQNPNVTYRQLGHAVLQQYQADSRQRPTPLFEGELDARVFGSDPVEALRQWPVQVNGKMASLPAGLLHRLSPGTRLAVLPSPLSTPDEAAGYLEVKSARNLSSIVVPVAFDTKPALDLSKLANTYARLVDVAVDFRLRVARPADGNDFGEEVAQVNDLLDRLVRLSEDPETKPEDRPPFRLELVGPGAEADLRLAVLRQDDKRLAAAPSVPADIVVAGDLADDMPALFFLPPSGELAHEIGQKSPRVIISQARRFEKGFSDNLTTIFRATNLSRLAALSDYADDQVAVKFFVKREGEEEMTALEEAQVPIARPGDEVHMLAENKTSNPVDINVLYIGSDYSITHIDSQRLVAGARIEEGMLVYTDGSYGMERMVTVLTEAPDGSAQEDLSFLAQPGVALKRTLGAGSDPQSLSDMLTSLGRAHGTRAAMKLGDKRDTARKGAVLIFPMETKPRLN